ncbi:MAG: ABC transporter permease [Candidatus Hadarchaeaceae archaeon]
MILELLLIAIVFSAVLSVPALFINRSRSGKIPSPSSGMTGERLSRWENFRANMGPQIRELKFSLRRIRKSPLSMAGISIIAFFAIIAVLAPVLAPPADHNRPYNIPRDGFSQTPKPPSETHPFGTTEGQFDIYYGVIWGTRTAFTVGLLVVGASMLVGIVLGALAGYFGGIIDEIIMRTTDIFFAVPALILAMAFVTAMGPGLDSVMKALILVWWPVYARLIRGEVLQAKQETYVEAARAMGASNLRIVTRHVLPNTLFSVLVMASLDLGAVVLTAAGLSFIGLGAPLGYADWGQMISFSRNWIVGPPGQPFLYWYTVLIPGLFIFFFVLGWSLLGDAVRDIMDPKLRRK